MNTENSRVAVLNGRLRDVSDIVSRLRGVRSEVASRLFHVTDEVSRAKAALLLRDETQSVLENFQLLVHSRTVGSYERLLSGLVNDVIGDGSAIRLELTNEAGAASLDVQAEKKGHRFSIMDAEGGALTNVVSMGLRLIATLRSGARPFLLLDEADCWTETERVPAFYGALSDMSTAMGLQIIAVTHKPVALIQHCNPRIFRVSGDPFSDAGVKVSVVNRGREHIPGTPGIRSIRLRDFAGYADVTFDIAPGLNVITGSNNVGKSRINRALRAMCYGESHVSDIRAGKRAASVTVTVDNGQTVEWSRETARNPVTMWKKTDANGNVTSAGGRSLPPWVDEVTGIARRSGLDVQLGHQKNAVFLLNDTGKQRAAVLSVGRESSILQEMMRLYRADILAYQATVRNGEKEVAVMVARLEAMKGLDDTANGICNDADIARLMKSEIQCAAARNSAVRISEHTAALHTASLKYTAALTAPPPEHNGTDEKARALMLRIEKGTDFIRNLHARRAVLNLPIVPVPGNREHTRAAAHRIENIRAELSRASEKLRVMKSGEPPVMQTNMAAAACKKIHEIQAALESRRTELTVLKTETEKAEREWKTLTDRLPCPVCGNDMTGTEPGAHPHG